eukprot:TRINITY_DN65546_c0_g1_i1.p1 TRINITY_DN65546_c0_g1~~TRINITY_DN65546_c0_g1_i1.p1  ORF type:complete len:1011 (+),score=243.86 TRINITY_DN65546_c0_g1_i1:67-3099(+)
MPQVPLPAWRPAGSAPRRRQHRWAPSAVTFHEYDRMLAKAPESIVSNAVWIQWRKEDTMTAAVTGAGAALAAVSGLLESIPPVALDLECPERSELAGRYALAKEEQNGKPLWTKGACRLYSDSAGQWRLTDDLSAMAKDCGWYTTTDAHRGRMPQRVLDWEYYSGKYPNGKWTQAKIKVLIPAKEKPKEDKKSTKAAEKKEEEKAKAGGKALPGFFEGKPVPKCEIRRLLGDEDAAPDSVKLRLWWDLKTVKVLQEGGTAAGKAQGKYGGWQDSTAKYIDHPCVCVSHKQQPDREPNTWTVKFNDGVERPFSSALLYRSMWKQLRALLHGIDCLADDGSGSAEVLRLQQQPGQAKEKQKEKEEDKDAAKKEGGAQEKGKQDKKKAVVSSLACNLLDLRRIRVRPAPAPRQKGKDRDAALKAVAELQPPAAPADTCLFAIVIGFLFHFPEGAPPGRLELLRRCFVASLTRPDADTASAARLQQHVSELVFAKRKDAVVTAVLEWIKPGGPDLKWGDICQQHRKAATESAKRVLAKKDAPGAKAVDQKGKPVKPLEKEDRVKGRVLVAPDPTDPLANQREVSRLCGLLELIEASRAEERLAAERIELELEAERWRSAQTRLAAGGAPSPASPPPPARPLGPGFTVAVEPPPSRSGSVGARLPPFRIAAWPGEPLGDLVHRIAHHCGVEVGAITLALREVDPRRRGGRLPRRRWTRLPAPAAAPGLTVHAAGLREGSALRCLPAGAVRLCVRLGPTAQVRVQVQPWLTLGEAAAAAANRINATVGVLCWPGAGAVGPDSATLDSIGLYGGSQATLEMRRRGDPAAGRVNIAVRHPQDPNAVMQIRCPGDITAAELKSRVGARAGAAVDLFPAGGGAGLPDALLAGELPGSLVAVANGAEREDAQRVEMSHKVSAVGAAVRRLTQQTTDLSCALNALTTRVGTPVPEIPDFEFVSPPRPRAHGSPASPGRAAESRYLPAGLREQFLQASVTAASTNDRMSALRRRLDTVIAARE